MALRPKNSHAGQTWLKKEFERTGLPHSGLADYMGLHKSAVTKIMAGGRQVSPAESDTARGFFSVVPQNAPPEMVEAISKLQTVRTRANATSEILRWLKSQQHPLEIGLSFALLIDTLTSADITLRADQIVAICRILQISIPALVGNAGVQRSRTEWPPENRRILTGDAISTLSAAARHWAKEAGLEKPYEFDQGKLSRIRSPTVKASLPVALKRTSSANDYFSSCEAFVVDGDNAEPLFHAGQTIYVERSTGPSRSGDLVACFSSNDADGDAIATIGYFSYQADDGTLIELPDGRRANISDALIRRIGFCRF